MKIWLFIIFRIFVKYIKLKNIIEKKFVNVRYFIIVNVGECNVELYVILVMVSIFFMIFKYVMNK